MHLLTFVHDTEGKQHHQDTLIHEDFLASSHSSDDEEL